MIKRHTLQLMASKEEWQKFISHLHFIIGKSPRDRFLFMMELLNNIINAQIDEGIKQTEEKK